MNSTESTKRKATRKIKKFDFSSDDSTVSLVGPAVGSGANGYMTLITKSNKKLSEDFIKKASEVQVTLEITEYLRRFFGIYWEDAEILARSLGFTTKEMEDAAAEDEDEYEFDYEEYLNEKLKSIKVMKSLHEAENIEKALIELSEDDYLQVLQDQAIVEKSLVDIEKACKDKGKKPVKKNSTDVAKATDEDSSTNVDVEKEEVSTSVVKSSNKEKSMTKEVQTIEQEVEVIAKSQFDEIQKALEDQKVELQKALDLVKQYEQEKKEAIAKSRKESLEKACGKHSEVIFKACGEASEEIFVEVVKALAEMQATIEKSALFEEQGASVSAEEDTNESSLAKVIKAKYKLQ